VVPVFLAGEKVEGVFGAQKVVVVQDLDGRHPVGITVFCNLKMEKS
jgi:hypothetical protein